MLMNLQLLTSFHLFSNGTMSRSQSYCIFLCLFVYYSFHVYARSIRSARFKTGLTNCMHKGEKSKFLFIVMGMDHRSSVRSYVSILSSLLLLNTWQLLTIWKSQTKRQTPIMLWHDLYQFKEMITLNLNKCLWRCKSMYKWVFKNSKKINKG